MILVQNFMLLFRAILSFRLILAWEFPHAMSTNFEQCWHCIYSKQFYQKINQFKIKITESDQMLFRRHCTGFFPLQFCLELLGQAVQCCPKSNKTTLNRIFFLWNVAWSLKDNIA